MNVRGTEGNGFAKMIQGLVELPDCSQGLPQVGTKTDRVRLDRHAAREQGRRLLGAPLLEKHDTQPLECFQSIRLLAEQTAVKRLGLSHPPLEMEALRHFDHTVSRHTVVPGLEVSNERASLGRPCARTQVL